MCFVVAAKIEQKKKNQVSSLNDLWSVKIKKKRKTKIRIVKKTRKEKISIFNGEKQILNQEWNKHHCGTVQDCHRNKKKKAEKYWRNESWLNWI